MYNHQVQQAEDIMSKFVFQVLMSANDGATPYYGALFQLLLLHYLEDPIDVRGRLVSDKDWSQEINNTVLCASLLLHATSDNDMLPASNTWCLTVSCYCCVFVIIQAFP
jgi:hypothetical protein